jgi:hypothetical protein
MLVERQANPAVDQMATDAVAKSVREMAGQPRMAADRPTFLRESRRLSVKTKPSEATQPAGNCVLALGRDDSRPPRRGGRPLRQGPNDRSPPGASSLRRSRPPTWHRHGASCGGCTLARAACWPLPRPARPSPFGRS